MKRKKTLVLLSILFVFSYTAVANEANTDKKISAKLVTSYEIDDITPLVEPILIEIKETNKKLQDVINQTQKLILSLKNSGELTDEQKVKLLESLSNVGKASLSIKNILDDRETILDGFEDRLRSIVNQSSLHGTWKDVKFWVFQIGLVVFIILIGLVLFVSYRFIKVVKEIPSDLKEASENLKYIADKDFK